MLVDVPMAGDSRPQVQRDAALAPRIARRRVRLVTGLRPGQR
jgi:hypothetical protein